MEGGRIIKKGGRKGGENELLLSKVFQTYNTYVKMCAHMNIIHG